MNLKSWMESVQKALVGTPTPPIDMPPSEFSTTESGRINEMLAEIWQEGQQLTLYFPQHDETCEGALIALDESCLKLRCNSHSGFTPHESELVNVVARSERGITMFTVKTGSSDNQSLWRAQPPSDLIRMQSRQHRRVRCVQRGLHRAELLLLSSETLPTIELVDLSEEGAGVVLQGTELHSLHMSGQLKLDDQLIDLPKITPVHHRALGAGRWRIGLRLEGMTPDASRFLRRWLNIAEASACLSR